MKYAWIVTQTASHSVRALCRALEVSPSGLYAWRNRPPSARAREDERLAPMIVQQHHEFREAYGTERLWRELRDRGEHCGRHRVARLRRRHTITTKRRRRFLARTGAVSAHRAGAQSFVLAVCEFETEPRVGWRHDADPNAPRLALSGGDPGSLLASCHRVGYGRAATAGTHNRGTV